MEISTARHAFITGGASGIGLGIADALASRGVPVTIADLNREALEAVVASRSGRVRGQFLDTRDRQGWADAKREAEEAFGPVDILINNAGIAPDGRNFADMDPESFDRVVGINLVGVFNGVSTFGADLRNRGKGHIVNTSSLAALTFAYPGTGAYSVAKFGVLGLSECLRIEMAPHGIGVSALCPGLADTNLAQSTVKLGGQVREVSKGVRDFASEVPRAAEMIPMNPADIGVLVVEGIERNSPYIMTHPLGILSVEKRTEAIRNAFAADGEAGRK